jgi:N-acylneuraminate cytidylyltransferase
MRVAIIPARGGSKRIPRKNIRPFAGKPIIVWPIKVALSSGLFDQVVVSTDDAEIAEVARAAGALVPFTRPENLSDDYADTKSVIRHAISELKLETEPDMQVCCIYPTSVFVDEQSLKEGLEKLNLSNCSFVLSVTSIDPNVYRSFTKAEDDRITMLFPENYAIRTQDLPSLYCDAAQFYWATVSAWQSDLNIFGVDSIGICIDPSKVQDIDSESQWLAAEQIFEEINQIR